MPSVSERLKDSFHPVDERGIEASIETIEVEDEWLLVRKTNTVRDNDEVEEE